VALLAAAVAALALAGWTRLAWIGLADRRALLRLLPGGLPGASAPAGPGPRAPPAQPGGGETVTAIVPCRDEALGVERAMRSLLAQDVEALQVVAVDDRSSDATGAILARLAAADPRLEVVRVDALPEGWLGKNHACHAGAQRARGDWLLFTDADVVFAPDALRRALDAAGAHRLGHLAVLPRFVAPGLLERAFVTGFAALLAPFVRVRDLRRPRTRAYFGVGAFNLVRRADYERAGGHRRLSLEVVDDVKLGLLLRRSGVAQGVADSGGLVQVRWQHGFLPSVLGLVKNAFAALEYRPGRAIASALAAAFAGAAPLAVLVAGPGLIPRALAAAALALAVAHHAEAARRLSGSSGAEGLLMPLCAVLLGAVVAGSAAAAWARGGVVWRGTRYPLERVRAGCLRDDELSPAAAVGWDGTP
jgi:hypothetical protein